MTSNPALNILISKGSRGAQYNLITVEASPIDVVNSNGAGDALIGTFLAYADTVSDKKALKEAVSYAAKVCKVNGPRL